MTVLCFAIECLCLLYRLTACIPITIVGTTIPPWYVSLVIGYRVLGYCASCFSPCFVYSSYIPCMINMITTHPSIQLIHLINRCLQYSTGFGEVIDSRVTAALQIAYACLNCPSRNVWYIIVDVTILKLCGLVKVLYVVVGEYVICSTISILVI